ncbi:SDR family oxidoreductase [Maricurvus nonylphenolicus]|uniref:SDR family NAD(P)-dependent oxidoreductase n=1 Tax=Maricurvus nonylphenolicus TaxID=1008307 RepID=UPI0036F2738A
MNADKLRACWSTAFISGANSGLGLYLAESFVRSGISLALFDLKFDEVVVQRLKKMAEQHQVKVGFWQTDLCDEHVIAEAAKAAAASIGSPDLAINCAGIQLAKTFDELSNSEFEKVIAVNLFGSRNFANAVLPVMQPGAQLAFLSSLAGLVPNYSYAAYNASKFAVLGMAGAIRLEELPRNIAVSVICPAEINTPMVEKELKTMHPVTRRLKSFAGTLEVDQACDEMIRSLMKKRQLIIPGFRPKFTYFLSRYFPGLMQRISESMVTDTLSKNMKSSSNASAV